MSSEWEISELSKEAVNASRPFSFKECPRVIFVNTGDVLSGKFLHANVSEGKRLPGQAKKALRKNDILLTEIRPGNERYAYVDFDAANYVVSTKFMVIESLGRVSPRFLYHVLTNQASLDEFQRIAESRSGTFPQITFDSIAHFPIPVPPTAEQNRLVAFWDELDDRINLLRETNATLEAIAQALFKSWFVDFDPVRAKQEGRAPEGMDEATAALFPDAFAESELGLVPKGWRVGKLEDLLVLQRGFDLPSTSRVVGEFPIIAASGPAGTHHEAMVQGPGVITGRSGVLGRVFLEFGSYWPLNTTLWVKDFRAATPCYAYELLKLLDFASFNAGSAVPTLNRNHVHSLPYLIPQKSCVDAYEGVARSVHERVKENERQAQTLATLRDTLLPRLISGQLRLPENPSFKRMSP